MEDRLNAGLMLVLFDKLSETSREEWQLRLAGNDAVTRTSWWRNLCPDRADWLGELQTIEEFETLAICELENLDPSVAPDDARSILFRRYPRPSQGVLRLPTMGLCLVLISPKNLEDDESSQSLRDWADFVHFPGIVDANIPGYGLVTPYENLTRHAPRYMHLYEFPDPDAEAVFQRTRPCVAQRFGGGPGNPGFDQWELHPEIQINYVNSFSRIAGNTSDERRAVSAASLA